MTTHIWTNDQLQAIGNEKWTPYFFIRQKFHSSGHSSLKINYYFFLHSNQIKFYTKLKSKFNYAKKYGECQKIPCLLWIWYAILFRHEYLRAVLYMHCLWYFEWVWLYLRACQMLIWWSPPQCEPIPQTIQTHAYIVPWKSVYTQFVSIYSLNVPPIIMFGCIFYEWRKKSCTPCCLHNQVVTWKTQCTYLFNFLLIPLRLINNKLLLFSGQLT